MNHPLSEYLDELDPRRLRRINRRAAQLVHNEKNRRRRIAKKQVAKQTKKRNRGL